MLSGYAYQVRYAIYRAVWIAAGRDLLSSRAAAVRLERRIRDRTGNQQWVDIVIEDADERPLELIETKEHEGFLPPASIESFLRRTDALRSVVPADARFRFVCNQKLTDHLDLSRDAERAQALRDLHIGELDGDDVLWDLGIWSKPSLVDRTMVLLARDGGDARDLYFRLHARASAQIAMRRPLAHGVAAVKDGHDLLSDYYTDAEHREMPSVHAEPALLIDDLRRAIGFLARKNPPVRGFSEAKIESVLRRQLFRDHRVNTAQIFVEPFASITFPAGKTAVAHAGDATSLLLRWMNDLHEQRVPREPLLLLGTFGVGKSTLLTQFAHSLLALADWVTPLLVPLRDLVGAAHGPLRDELERYLREEYHVDFSVPPDGDSLRYLVLCDGFDELNLYYSRKDVREWVDGAYGVLRSVAQRRDTGVVVSSRPILFMERQRRNVLAQPVLELAEFDQRRIDLWCANYRRARPRISRDFNYAFLRARQLHEVAQTPIVLYMLALLCEDGWLEKKRYTNADVFRTFVDWTESGGYGGEDKHRLPHNYREILQDIAWFILLGGEERLADSTLLSMLQAKYGTITSDQIGVGSNLLVAHMLQPARGKAEAETLIEFTHQALREYLAAERFWRLTEPLRRGEPATYALWKDAAGARLTRAEIAFVEEMVIALPEREARNFYSALDAMTDVTNTLNDSVAFAREKGGEIDLWTVVRSMIVAFILRIKTFRRLLDLAPKRKRPVAPGDMTLRALLDFTSALAQEGSDVRRLLTESLDGLRLEPGAELSNIDLADAEMGDVVLKQANLSRAVLPGVTLYRSSFTACDFSRASIAVQYLFRTRFVDCNFTCAEIHIKNEDDINLTALNTFTGCNFTNAMFTGLVVRQNRFTGCTWDGASVQAEDAIVADSTLDSAARRFFRSQNVVLTKAVQRRRR